MKYIILTGATGSIGSELKRRIEKMFDFRVFTFGRDSIRNDYSIPDHFPECDMDPFMVRDLPKDFNESLYALINCAGGNFITPSLSMPIKEFMGVLDVNITLPFWMSQQFIKRIAYQSPNNKSLIINIGSMGGRYALRNSAPYCTSKAGLVALTKQMARDFGDKFPNLNIVCVSPNNIEGSNLVNYAIERSVELGRFKSVDEARDYNTQSPLGRNQTHDELWSVIKMLLLENPQYLTGTNIEFMGAGI